MKVYIVKGTAGSYEDYTEWVVYASNDKTLCENKKKLCQEQAEKFYDAMSDMRFETEKYDCDYCDDGFSEYDKFITERTTELQKILTEDTVAGGYEYEVVYYVIREIEVDVVS